MTAILGWFNPTRWIALAVLFAALGGVYAWRVHVERDIGREEVRAEWDKERVANAAAAQLQAERNRDLQRAAELRYTVRAEVREEFIAVTVKEIRHATDNLAACVLSPAAVDGLRRASACAREDSAAACGAGQ